MRRASAVLAFALLLAFAPSASAAPKRIVNQIGSVEGSEAGGHFYVPFGVAVNQTGEGGVQKGTFYIVDSQEHRRVQRFDPSGAFVSAWGFGVKDGNAEYEICTHAQECKRGSGSTAAGALAEPRTIAVDQSNGNVYVADGNPGAFSSNRRINVFSATGDFEGAFGLGVRGDFTENFEFCTMQTGCGQSFFANGQGGAFPNGIGGLAVDSEGHVYVANPGYHRVDVFEPVLTGGTVTGVEFLRSFGWGVNAGNPQFEVCTVSAECKEGLAGSGLGQFAAGSPSDVAVDSEGHVFALDAGNKRVQEFSSTPAPPAPLDPSFGSTALEALFGANPQLLNLAVDPSATPNHLLVSATRPADEGRVAIAELNGSGANALGAGQVHGEELPITAAKGLAVAEAETGGNLYLSTATVGVLRGAFVLNELPTVEEVTDITGTSATFKGTVVSNGIDVSYHFEYSTDGKTWTRVPAADVDAGTAPGTIAVEQQVNGLTGSQPYRVRLVQNRPLGGIATSEELTFTTLAERPAILGTVAFPVKDTSATFNAYLDPQNEATSYRFEYGPADCAANPCTALPPSQANGGGLRLITQTATGLLPATLYHFRLLATNATGTAAGPDRTFETSAAGRSLPDDRAYELVTPPDTGAAVPSGAKWGESIVEHAAGEHHGRDCFDMFPASADGNSVVFGAKGASLPGLEGNGFLDLYEALRGPNGWRTVSKSATGAQSTAQGGGPCSSPDHLYSTLGTAAAPGDQGSLVVAGKQSNYIRVPNGVVDPACSPEPQGLFELVGCGSLGIDPEADARWLTAKASHLVFSSRVQLEPDAPPSGTEAVYDRSPGGQTHVVSLLPGEVTPAAGQSASYQGASTDGSTVAFKLPANGTIYARVDNATTIGAPDALVGESLSCTGGPTSEVALSYQWLRNGAPIGAATSSTYTTQAADAGAPLQCQVTATNTVEDAQGGFTGSTQVSNPATVVEPVPATAPPLAPPFGIGPPVPSGWFDGSATEELTCNAGSWRGSPTSYTYQWYRNGAPFGSPVGPTAETSTTLTLSAAEQTPPAAFQCAVTATNAGGSVSKVSFNLTTEYPNNPSPGAPEASATTPTAKAFAGLSDDGDHLFWEQAGKVFDLDTASGTTERLVGSGDAQLVNISGDGSHVYFVSKSLLTGTEKNSRGREAQATEDNLYVWDRASEAIHFVAVVDPQDVSGGATESLLTRWTSEAVTPNQNASDGRGKDSSRTTPDGSVLVFESRADLTGYDSGGHVEIYRYDAQSGALDCVSCPPDGVAAGGDARLQAHQGFPLYPVNDIDHLQNVTDDGRKVFFQTDEALVPGDVNGTWDVYEWKAGQQAYLISSGHGQLPSYLYAMTPSGSDAFFTSAERLVPQDLSTVISIYDARVGGGFPISASQSPCQGDSCQGTPGIAPPLAGAGSASFQGPGNEAGKPKHHCRRNQRRVKRGGKLRCVKKHRRKTTKHHHRASHNGRAGR